MRANMRKVIAPVELCTKTTPTTTVAKASPNEVQALRTRVGVAPAAMARSAIQPVTTVATAVTQKTTALNLDIWSMEKPRSRTR